MSMMGDNVEHVLTYWVMWRAFHSPVLAGFAVVSHWVPFLFAFWFGGLADRLDCRRLIQVGQLIFMGVSATWALLIATDSLAVWGACLLLVAHGVAGAIWTPAEQLMLHDFVGPRDLPSAVRLNATARSLGILCGPAVGSLLLVNLGPSRGLVVNVFLYLPMTLFLFRTRFTGHLRGGRGAARLTPRESIRVLGELRRQPEVASMVLLAALGSVFVGAAIQTVMPELAEQVRGADAATAYAVMLLALGSGGVLGGVLLEVTGRIKATVGSAVIALMVYGAALTSFTATTWLLPAALLLFVAGVGNLAATSIGQTIVQLRAAPEVRGRAVGVYAMAAQGMRAFSGITVGLLGGLVGVRMSLAVSACCIVAGCLWLGLYVRRRLGHPVPLSRP
jgi:MFS family permease